MDDALKKSLYEMIKDYYLKGIYTDEQLQNPFVKAGYISEEQKDELIQMRKDAAEKQTEPVDEVTSEK